MAGNKRALSQIDSNTAPSQPPSKQQSQQPAAGKENEASRYAAMKKQDLSTLLQQRNLPYSGNKDVLVRRLEDSDRLHTAPSTSATGEICPGPLPLDDIRAEKRATRDASEKSNEEEDEHDGQQDNGLESQNDQRESICGLKGCVCKRPASEFPGHKWMLTTKGYLLVARLQWELNIRNQDAAGEHFYNDFNGYGFQEVMENQLVSFNRFAWILEDTYEWFNVDDPNTVLHTLKLIGGAVFTTLNSLEKNGLLCPDSAVKNIALVLGVLYDNTRDWPGDPEPQLEWREAMIREAFRHGIEVKGQPNGIETVLEEDGIDRTLPSEADSKWKNFNWTKEFKAFSKKHRKGRRSEADTSLCDPVEDVTRAHKVSSCM
ncbi:hypothetical protein AYO20_08642 [Fonsecaea nubica]|uniref:SAP domain-containing protein n=1 Tax=Fonsecaea nubica TaxID=856822 RepID=A0A178CL87_9EURO|nr:hypothetical protein AYO20_08642 [Fonsecaea nubica]OAL30680.1 hypothetical protein AYO20_08642 [Fonsecaea nubica]